MKNLLYVFLLLNLLHANTLNIHTKNNTHHSKTKTLATLGSGNIQIADKANSDTTMLNRDITNNTVDIYNISSHKGLKGELDTRLLTDDGRKSIKEDVQRTKRLGTAIADIATSEAFELKDTFAHIDETQKDLDVQKQMALLDNGKYITILQGEDASPQQKQEAIEQYAQIYAKTYNINIEQAKVIATSKLIKGATHNQSLTNNNIYINDETQRNATDYANTMGHEVTHARVNQGITRDRESEILNEEYAKVMGSYSADGMEFTNNNYTNNTPIKQITITNTHKGNKDSTLLQTNTKAFADVVRRDGDSVDYHLTPTQLAQADAQYTQSKSELEKRRIMDAARVTSAAQDMLLSKAKAECAVANNCEKLQQMQKSIKQQYDIQTIDKKIKQLNPNLTEEEVLAKRNQYLQEAQDSLDKSTFRTIIGTLDAVSVMGDVGTFAKLTVKGITKLGSGKVKVELEGGKNVVVPENIVYDNKGIYNPKQVKQYLEEKYGAQNVAKHSIDKITNKAIIETSAGKKGSWNQMLNKDLEPNTKFKVKTKVGETHYETDELGRAKEVKYEVKNQTADRNQYQQTKAGKTGGIKDAQENDQGGHLQAATHGGAGEQINYLPQDAHLNNSEWKKMENSWTKAANEGKKVEVKIKPTYEGSSKRPSEYRVEYSIDGQPYRKKIKNISSKKEQ